jgi:hypothetical protein
VLILQAQRLRKFDGVVAARSDALRGALELTAKNHIAGTIFVGRPLTSLAICFIRGVI